jgi:hypothetical protein
MNVHKNARTTSHGRLLLVQRVRRQGWRVAEAASAAGVSKRTAYKWLARYDARSRGYRFLPRCKDAFIPTSMRRRSASEREGLSGCWVAQASMAAIDSGGRRKAMSGSRPVAGRPRFLGITDLLDIALFSI